MQCFSVGWLESFLYHRLFFFPFIQTKLPPFLSFSQWTWQQLISVPFRTTFYVLEEGCYANLLFCCQAEDGVIASLPIQHQEQDLKGSHLLRMEKQQEMQRSPSVECLWLNAIDLSQVSLLEVNPKHLFSVAELFTAALPGSGMDGTKLLWLFPHEKVKQNRKLGSDEVEKLCPWH